MTRVSFAHTETPVVVINCQIGALAIMRSLGPLGVQLYGVDGDAAAPAFGSRYCREHFVLKFSEDRSGEYLEGLLAIGRKLKRKAILIATSDETTEFVADHRESLREHFLFQDNPPELVRRLASKQGMFALATEHAVPTPHTVFPQRIEDVYAYAERGTFPVMLKGIYGNRLAARTQKKMVLVESREELH